MKAIVFPAKGEVLLTDLPEPTPEPGQVVVDVRASGICHTDFEVLSANYGTSAFPLVPGHEFAGVVSDVASDVDGLQVGDRVAVDPNVGCGDCRPCRRGWSHLCETLRAYGVTMNGGFAERCVVDAAAVYPIGDMPFHIAALAEPMGCVLNGVSAAARGDEASALVIGAGPMGVLMALALKSRGIPEVSVADIDAERVEKARALGIDGIDAHDLGRPEMQGAMDLVVEATGVPSVAESAIGLAAPGGTVLFFGVSPSTARISVSPFEVFRRQLRICGSHSLNHNIAEALEVLKEIGSGVEAMISHRLPLEDVSRVLSGSRLSGSLKIQAILG